MEGQEVLASNERRRDEKYANENVYVPYNIGEHILSAHKKRVASLPRPQKKPNLHKKRNVQAPRTQDAIGAPCVRD